MLVWRKDSYLNTPTKYHRHLTFEQIYDDNLDEDLNPMEVTIVSLNESKFSNSSFLKKFISFTQVMANNAGNSIVSVEDAFNGVSGINKSEKNFLKNNLTKDIEKIMKTLVNDLKKVLRKYIMV